jgi:hypothetical protein
MPPPSPWRAERNIVARNLARAGEYMFQAIARDQLTPHKFQMATQWTDLELVK